MHGCPKRSFSLQNCRIYEGRGVNDRFLCLHGKQGTLGEPKLFTDLSLIRQAKKKHILQSNRVGLDIHN